MTRAEELWGTITDLTGRIAAVEREQSMLRPRMRQQESAALDTSTRVQELEWHMRAVLDRLQTAEQAGQSIATDMADYKRRRLGDVWKQYKEDIGYIAIILLLLSANKAVPDFIHDILKGVSAGGLLGG